MADVAAVVDLETTGVNISTDHIVQLACVMTTVNEGVAAPVTLFSSYCNPGVPIPAEATAVHHITDEQVQGAPTPVQALGTMMTLIEEIAVNDDVYIVGHNSHKFDLPFICNVAPDLGLAGCAQIDTYTMAMRLFPSKEQKLAPLYEWFIGGEAMNAHDAAADCHMVAHILAKMLKETGMTMEQASAWCMTPMVLSTMPFGKHKGMPMERVPKGYLGWCKRNFTDSHQDIDATLMAYT